MKLKNLIIDQIVKFIFLFVLGGALTFIWQNIQNTQQAKNVQRKYEMEKATNLFDEITVQLNKQISNFQLILDDSTLRSKCINDYLVWNENKTRYRAIAEKFFGNSASESVVHFDSEIQGLFNQIIIHRTVYEKPSINTRIDYLNKDAIAFSLQLIDDLLSDNIGSSRSDVQKQ